MKNKLLQASHENTIKKRYFSLIGGLPGADGEYEEDNDVTMVSLDALLEIGMSIMTSLHFCLPLSATSFLNLLCLSFSKHHFSWLGLRF